MATECFEQYLFNTRLLYVFMDDHVLIAPLAISLHESLMSSHQELCDLDSFKYK